MKSGRLPRGVALALSAMVFAPPVSAGDLNPPGPPAPTMKTLNQTAPTWDQKLLANDGPLVNGLADPCSSSRFKCVLDGAAVLDKETGLVWERYPDIGNSKPWITTISIPIAVKWCVERTVGGRKGWRLPTIEELESLVDTSVPSADPTLPAGHPFSFFNISPWTNVWSSTTYPVDTSQAWLVNFNSGTPGTSAKSLYWHVWCVRGGRNHDN